MTETDLFWFLPFVLVYLGTRALEVAIEHRWLPMFVVGWAEIGLAVWIAGVLIFLE